MAVAMHANKVPVPDATLYWAMVSSERPPTEPPDSAAVAIREPFIEHMSGRRLARMKEDELQAAGYALGLSRYGIPGRIPEP
jgi:hypothetical protein